MELLFETANVIIGGMVILLTSIPFILKKTKYLLLTSNVSLLMLLLLFLTKP